MDQYTLAIQQTEKKVDWENYRPLTKSIKANGLKMLKMGKDCIVISALIRFYKVIFAIICHMASANKLGGTIRMREIIKMATKMDKEYQ